MTMKPLGARDKKVMRLLLEGNSRFAIASKMKLAPRTVYNIVEKLVYLGYIRQVPGTKSPAIYEQLLSPETNPPTGDYKGKGGKDGAAISKDGTPLGLGGIRYDKECPDGYVEAHLNGAIPYDLKRVGTFDDPQIKGRGYVGAWERSKVSKHNGCSYHSGFIRIDGVDTYFTYRVGDKGSQTFTLYPKRICLDPCLYKTEEDAKSVFLDRANLVAEILAYTGWKLENPQLKGKFHYAIPHHPLAQLLPKGVGSPDDDIIIDTSPGCPEAEMENPDDWTKVQIFANMPSHILEAENNIQSLFAKVDELDSLLDGILNVQQKTTVAVLNNAENISRLVQSDAQLSALILNNQESVVYTYGNTSIDKKLEGYQ
ncbi:MAG: hypothetical protein E7Z67_04880 [Thermoplasmata archaeon]|nr:hypothetical protein [Thermoplasmata archaeon]